MKKLSGLHYFSEFINMSNNRIIGGVCNRIGEYFRIDVTIVRIFWVVITLVTFIIPGLFVYIVLWLTGQPQYGKDHKKKVD